MDIHKPKPIHNLRELGTEIGVIVMVSASIQRRKSGLPAVIGHAATHGQ